MQFTRDGRIKPDVTAPGAGYNFPDKVTTPMSVELDYIIFKRKSGAAAKVFNFTTDGNSEGWKDQGGYTNAGDAGAKSGKLTFSINWVGAWIANTTASSWITSVDDSLIIRYRIKHPQIPSKMKKLRCGFSWDAIDFGLDNLYFSLPTPDTLNFQVFRAALSTMYGHLDLRPNDIDLSNGVHRWPTTAHSISQMFFHFAADTSSDGILAANVMASNAPRYAMLQGTSEAAPHVTGVAALILEKWAKVVVPGANLDTQGPWNSTVKAILVHTATDMVKTKPSQEEKGAGGDGISSVNRDLCGYDATGGPHCTKPGMSAANSFVQYYAGPDYSTGYGLINAEKALQYTNKDSVLQDFVRPDPGAYAYKMSVPSGLTKLRVTLAWDDLPGDANRPMNESKLVNDLDLTVQDPSGKIYYPWVLDPLPQSLGNPQQLPADGIDPIAPTDIKPAHTGLNHRDNVEVVDVKVSSGLPAGTWKVNVNGFRLQAGSKQDYSLVSDFKLTKITRTIGWIQRNGPCPEGTGRIVTADELDGNATSAVFRTTGTTGAMSPWTGGGISKFSALPGTWLSFCRESIDALPRTANPYAVLQLSGSCPSNAISFARITDNENAPANNINSGNVSPSSQTVINTGEAFTKIWFCYVKGDNSTGDPIWKSRGHGAFSNVNLPVNGGCNEMHAHLEDDEDTNNGNKYDWSHLTNPLDSNEIKANIFNNSTIDNQYFWNACP